MKNRRARSRWNSAAEVLSHLLPDLPIAGRVEEYQVWEIWEVLDNLAVEEETLVYNTDLLDLPDFLDCLGCYYNRLRSHQF